MEPRANGLSDLVEVGRGGFGTVYRASDERFGRQVAVKVIRDAGLGRQVVARFERECLALGSLSGHPNIVSVYDSGTTADGDLYLVMEYLSGGSLSQRLADHGPVDAIEVATWGAALAGALETAHRSGIVHRDVKPENVLFSEYGTLKLVDFGIARMRSAYETRSGFISATLNHAAPEVVSGTPVSPSADVYSLASVLFTMLSGRAPFEKEGEDSLAPLIARIVNSSPPDLRPHGVPDAIAAVVERALLKPVEERYGSAADFGHALQAAAAASGAGKIAVPVGAAADVAVAAAVIQAGPDTPGEGERPATIGPVESGEVTNLVARNRPAVEPLMPAPEPPRRHRRVLIGAAAAVALILAAAAFVFWPGRGEEPAAATPGRSSASAAAGTAISVADTPTQAAGMRIARTYSLPKGKAVSSTVVLRNVTKQPLTRTWPEVIPKQLAADVSQVTFSQPPTKIINRDPIVAWKVRLAPGKTRTISWTTKLPPGQTANKALLAKTVQWHREAVVTSAKEVDAAVNADSKGKGGSVISAGESVGGIPASTGSGSSGVAGGSIGGSIGGGSTSTGGTGSGGSGGGSGGGSASTSGGGSGGQATVARANRAPSVTVPGSSTSNELTRVSYNVGVSDPDGNPVTTRISGLPSGVGASGAKVSGTISRDAANATQSWSNIGSRAFTVSVTATDSHGKSTTRSFRWTVRDTHLAMPNYIGKFGDGSDGPMDIGRRLTSHHPFYCAYDPNGDGNKVWRQGVAAGATIAWNQTIAFWYGKNDSSGCQHVARGW